MITATKPGYVGLALLGDSTGDARLEFFRKMSPGQKCVTARDGRDSKLSTYNHPAAVYFLPIIILSVNSLLPLL